MDDKEQQLMRRLYELQLQLFDYQGEEIKALRRASESLQKSHEIIGEMLKTTASLIKFS
jgi:hypothetical protein